MSGGSKLRTDGIILGVFHTSFSSLFRPYEYLHMSTLYWHAQLVSSVCARPLQKRKQIGQYL